jgi:hypothetical protein
VTTKGRLIRIGWEHRIEQLVVGPVPDREAKLGVGRAFLAQRFAR